MVYKNLNKMCKCSIVELNILVKTISYSRTRTANMITQILNYIKSWFPSDSYRSSLERYINSHYPKDNGDVERLTRDYEKRLAEGRIYL